MRGVRRELTTFVVDRAQKVSLTVIEPLFYSPSYGDIHPTGFYHQEQAIQHFRIRVAFTQLVSLGQVEDYQFKFSTKFVKQRGDIGHRKMRAKLFTAASDSQDAQSVDGSMLKCFAKPSTTVKHINIGMRSEF